MTYYRIVHKVTEWGEPTGNIIDMAMPFDEDGTELDPFDFLSAKKLTHINKVDLRLELSGPPNDFIFASFDIPICHKRIIRALQGICPHDFQAIDVITGFNDIDYTIINVLALADCIDEAKSRILYWTEKDGIPSKVGKFKMAGKLVLNPVFIGCHDLFRLEKWEIAIVVSQRVKDVFEELKVSGISFWPMELAG
jgi:hypothetical protein